MRAGGVTGTVATVDAARFVLNDGQSAIGVTSRGFLPEGLQAGSPVTVVGRVRHGAIQANQIICDD